MQCFIVFMGNRKLLGLFRGSRFESVRCNNNKNGRLFASLSMISFYLASLLHNQSKNLMNSNKTVNKIIFLYFIQHFGCSIRHNFRCKVCWMNVIYKELETYSPLFIEEYFWTFPIHSSLEASLRKNRAFRQKPIQKFGDVLQYFWIRDVGDNSKITIF